VAFSPDLHITKAVGFYHLLSPDVPHKVGQP
jgi:hypothetical protein